MNQPEESTGIPARPGWVEVQGGGHVPVSPVMMALHSLRWWGKGWGKEMGALAGGVGGEMGISCRSGCGCKTHIPATPYLDTSHRTQPAA